MVCEWDDDISSLAPDLLLCSGERLEVHSLVMQRSLLTAMTVNSQASRPATLWHRHWLSLKASPGWAQPALLGREPASELLAHSAALACIAW